MKKFMALILALCMACSLAACGGNDPASDDPTNDSPSTNDTSAYTEKLVEKGKLTIGTTGAAAPFSYYNDKNELVGYDIEIGTMLAEALGLEPNFVVLDWSGLLPGLQSGRFDLVMSGVTMTTERMNADGMTLTKPYTVNGVVLARKAGNTEINGWDDLPGKIMGCTTGSAQAQMALARLPEGTITETKEYPGWAEMLLDLEAGRVDYLIMDFLGLSYYQLSGNANLEIVGDPLVLTTQAVAIYSDETALAEKVTVLINEYRENGTLAEAITRNFGSYLPFDLMDTTEIAY